MLNAPENPEAPTFEHQPAFDAAEAPDRVYLGPNNWLFKVKVTAKTDAQIGARAPRYGHSYLLVTASLCGEDGKALEFIGGPLDRAIGRGVSVTIKPHPDGDVASDLEEARQAALRTAYAQAVTQDQIASVLGQSAPSA